MDVLMYPIVIPLIAGAVILLVPKVLRGVRELVALAGTILTAYYAGLIFFSRSDLASSWTWFTIERFSFSADLCVDTLNGFILMAASLFAVLIVIYSIGFMKGGTRLNEYYGYLLWTAGAANLVLLSDNLIVLLIGWEITTVLLFLLITMGEKGANEAAGKTFVIAGFSDSALLMGIILLWNSFGTLSITEIHSVPTDSGYLVLAYVLMLVGALVKAGAIPGHTWIPTSAESAPVSVMAYLPGSLDKLLGIYLLARISLDMFVLNWPLKLVLLIIGGVTIILAVMMALVQHNVKKLLAFHAVSQVGYMVMGIGTGVPAGIIGGLFHMLNNAIYKFCLFLCAGAVEKRTGTSDLEKLGGLAKAMPVTFISMLIAALSISGVPPFNGFASKWLVYQGTIEIGMPVFLVTAMFGSALTLASFIKVIHSIFFGRKPENIGTVKPAGFAMSFPVVVLAALCVLFGVFPQVPLRYIGASVGIGFDRMSGALATNIGLWNPSLATLLLVIALLAGLVVYMLTSVSKPRVTSVFVGGEKFEAESIRFPGTGFYETIRDIVPLNVLYRDAEAGVFDLYVLGGRYGEKLVGVLRLIHNGVVSTYMGFVVVGLVAILFFLMR